MAASRECTDVYEYSQEICQLFKKQYERGDYKTPDELKTETGERPHYYHCDATECKYYNVLCWGDVRDPHMKTLLRESARVLKNSGGGHPMSLVHRMSQEKLVEYHRDGGSIEIIKECESCHSANLFRLPTEGCRACINYRDGDGSILWDVAFIDESDEVKYAIEAMHTHKTVGKGLERRIESKVVWSEHQSVEIVEQIEKCDEDSSIRLKDIRSDNIIKCMSEKCVKDRAAEEAKNISKDIRMSAPRESMPGYSMKEGHGTFKEIHLDLANKLYCYFPSYNGPTQKIVDEANCGGFSADRWASYLRYDEKDIVMKKCGDVIERHKRCIRCCAKNGSVSRYRPYCIDCHRRTEEEEKREEGRWISVSEERKEELRAKIRPIMDRIPIGGKLTNCSVCRIEPSEATDLDIPFQYWEGGTNFMRVSTWWCFGWGTKCRSICTRCLETKFKKAGIIP